MLVGTLGVALGCEPVAGEGGRGPVAGASDPKERNLAVEGPAPERPIPETDKPDVRSPDREDVRAWAGAWECGSIVIEPEKVGHDWWGISVETPGIPAIREDGQVIAHLALTGPELGEKDVDLVLIDRAGRELDRARLFQPAEDVAFPACSSWREDRRPLERVAAARALLAGAHWRPLEHLPEHSDLVRDEGYSPEECPGRVDEEVPPGARAVTSCGGTPRVVELALIAGPTLVLREPHVRVLARRRLEGLRAPPADEWDPGGCSHVAIVNDAWWDPKERVVLVEFGGASRGRDSCSYDEFMRVFNFSVDELPARELESGRVWVRQYAQVEG